MYYCSNKNSCFDKFTGVTCNHFKGSQPWPNLVLRERYENLHAVVVAIFVLFSGDVICIKIGFSFSGGEELNY